MAHRMCSNLQGRGDSFPTSEMMVRKIFKDYGQIGKGRGERNHIKSEWQ